MAAPGFVTGPSPIHVAIIEDQERVRKGLAALISGTRGFECTGCYAGVEDALGGIDRLVPHIVLVDIGLPGVSGIEGIRILSRCYPGTACVVLTIYEDEERIFEALCAGASGYLLKSTALPGCWKACARWWKMARRRRRRSRAAWSITFNIAARRLPRPTL